MEQKKSFLHTIHILMRVQMLLIGLVVVLFALTTYYSARTDMEEKAEGYLEAYVTALENRLDKVSKCLATVVYDSSQLELLESSHEIRRQYAAINLSKSLANIMNTDDSADLIVVAETCYGACIDGRNTSLVLAEKEALRNFTRSCAEEGISSGAWEIMHTEKEYYLYRTIVTGNHATAVFISVRRLLDSFPSEMAEDGFFLLTDEDGMTIGTSGVPGKDYRNGVSAAQFSDNFTLVHSLSFAEGRLVLYFYQSLAGIKKQIRGSILLLFAVILFLYLFGVYFSRRIRRELIVPMRMMTGNMEHIKNGKYDLRIQTVSDSIEFQTLTQSFNHLMDEIIHLKIQYYEEKLAFADAEQKYIRLQIRPHFFLNAMTTIVSLSRSSKNQEIETYIEALSKNIRYMFNSGLHTVPIKEEIRHVQNYFMMQELKYPGGVFHYEELPSELEEWRVPQMLIHTLIENEYKYAVNIARPLMILIQISLFEENGEEMLMIRVEDDGAGYPEEVLSYMEGSTAPSEESNGSRIGLWSIRRLLELMYDRKGLFRIQNVTPHGALNCIYIPKEPVHERDREYLKETGIQ